MNSLPVIYRATALAIGICSASVQGRASEALGVLPEGAEAMGKIGGRLATQSDPAVVRTNPANLSTLDQTEVQISLGGWYGDLGFSPTRTGESIELLDDWVFVGSAYFATPLSDKVVFGLGLSAPFGLEFDRDDNNSIRYLSPFEARLLTLDVSPAIAVDLSDTLSVGVGMDLVYSRFELGQRYPFGLLTGSPLTPEGTLDYDADGFGFGGFAGLNWEFAPDHRLALTGHLPIKISYEGDFEARNLPAGLKAAGFSDRSDFESEIEFPGSLGIGYAWNATDRLTLSTDFQYFFNSSHSSIPLMIGNNQPLLGGATELALNWEDSYDVGFGVEYALSEIWTLRAGYLFSSNPYPTETFHPAVPSNERHIASVGLGYERGRHRVDLSFSHVAFPDRNISGNIQPGFNGDYTFGYEILTVSYGLKF